MVKEEKELGEKVDLSRAREKELCNNNAYLPVFLLIPPCILPFFLMLGGELQVSLHINICELFLSDSLFLLLFCYRNSNYAQEKGKSNLHILYERQHRLNMNGHKARGNLVLMACTSVDMFYNVLENLK